MAFWQLCLVSFETLPPPRLIAVVNALGPPLAPLGHLPRPNALLPDQQWVTDGGDRSPWT